MRRGRRTSLCIAVATVVASVCTVGSNAARAAVVGSRFVALTPTRILDSRPGLVPDDGIEGQIGASGAVVLHVAGRGGVPAGGVTAVVLNVAVTEALGAGFVQVAPSDAPLGTTANLNVTAVGQTISNQVTVPLGPDGSIRFYLQSGGHLVADVFGYFSESAATATGRYEPLAAPTPRRILDTRDPLQVPVADPGDTADCGDFPAWHEAWYFFWTFRRWGDPARLDGNSDGIPCDSLPGGPKTASPPPDLFMMGAGASLRLPITTGSDLPGGLAPPGHVTAVVLNLAVTDAIAAGYWQVVPTGGGAPFGSSANLNVERRGQTISNQVIVPVGADGTITIFAQSGGHVIVDVAGVFSGPSSAVSTSGLFRPITPSRLLDTRDPTNTPQLGPIPGGAAVTIQGSGRFGIPQPVSALAMNVAIADALRPGYVQVFPPGGGTPGGSATVNVEFAGQVISNATLASVDPNGRFSIFTQGGGHLVADVSGYFTTTTTPPPGADPVVLAAGDIAACSSSGDEATAAILAGQPGTVITLGDNVYSDGTAAEFANCYDPSWGAHKARTRPSPGNHDYHTAGASGYFGYFGAAAGDPAKGYYSYDLGDWHVVSLNSNCSTVSCSSNSPQVTWLRADLAASGARCTLAYWHHPRFSSGSNHGSSTSVQPLYQALYDHDADLILVGHEHNYERFAPLTPTGSIDTSRGIRQFVVGTGGRSHYGFGPAITGSEVRDGSALGVLKITLEAGSYDWQFLPVAGQTFTDSGTQTCHRVWRPVGWAEGGPVPARTATPRRAEP